VHRFFRGEVRLKETPQKAVLRITADSRYLLHVNGQFVGYGPVMSVPHFQYYDELDVTGLLREGDNAIGALVFHVGHGGGSRGGLLAELSDGEGNVLAATDGAWRTVRAECYHDQTTVFGMNAYTPYQEIHDARKRPMGWDEAGFDDTGWELATVVAGRTSDTPPAVEPWTVLVPRDIPPMREEVVHAERIERIEECTDIRHRGRPENLALALSAVGSESLEHTRVDDPEALLGDEGETFVQSYTPVGPWDSVDGMRVPCVVLDFGRVITARCEIELVGADGASVDIGYVERLLDGQFNNAIECWFADRCYLAEGKMVYRPTAWKAFRYLKLRFQDCPGGVTVRAVRAVTTTYPYEPRGRFESSDEVLNGSWAISRRTLELCSNEFLMDTPWREAAQWLGDVSAVTLGGIYACFGDTALPGKYIRQVAANAQPTGLLSNVTNRPARSMYSDIPDYSLWWVRGLWNHYLYTGERRWAEHYYPQAAGVMRAHGQYRNDRGLIEEMPYWVFIDWAHIDRRGQCAAYNAIYYGALEAMEKLAELGGDAYTLSRTREAMGAIREAFVGTFWDERRGLLADARVEGELSSMAREQANLAAIRWGLVDEATTARILDTLYGGEWPEGVTQAEPFFTSVVLAALDRVDRFDLALEVVRDRWGRRMLDRGATSVFEEWQSNGSFRHGFFTGFYRTHSHAWSAAPAEFLIRNLMGVEIVEPGCRRLRVSPRRTDFDYVATFPTPAGDVTASCRGGEVTVEAPDGVEIVS
jgi:hypothetical protein